MHYWRIINVLHSLDTTGADKAVTTSGCVHFAKGETRTPTPISILFNAKRNGVQFLAHRPFQPPASRRNCISLSVLSLSLSRHEQRLLLPAIIDEQSSFIYHLSILISF